MKLIPMMVPVLSLMSSARYLPLSRTYCALPLTVIGLVFRLYVTGVTGDAVKNVSPVLRVSAVLGKDG